MRKKLVGDVLPLTSLHSIKDELVAIPVSVGLTHLQFRRFAGCPICNLHLQSFLHRADELKRAKVQEVAVFHATKETMLESVIDLPFALIADPSRRLYRDFGVESSWRSVLNISLLKTALQGLRQFGLTMPQSLEAELGLPADFLIDQTGKIVALKYGAHADDQWSVDEVLQLSAELS